MIGLRSLTTSPSRSTTRRKTPCVAGWCGPMLTVITSVSRAWAPVDAGTPVSAIVAFVVGEGDRLAAYGEVPALRPTDVILRQQDPAQVGVPVEHDSEEVE